MIRIRNVQKSFGENQILKGINLAVKPREVVCLLGPSGSGKTTFLRCLNFLEQADKGSITIDDVQVGFDRPLKNQVRDICLKTAMVFQGYELFSHMTALQNVMEGLVTARKMPKRVARKLAISMLEKVGLEDKALLYPSQLSGGQQQRVGIARAMALSPELLLFDEPTSALDPELVGEVLETMRQLANEGQTMIIVTHEMQFAYEVADKIVFMADGVVVEKAATKDFFHNPQEEKTKEFLAKLNFREAVGER